MLRVALAQINSTVGDLVGNQRKIRASIHQAKVMGADFVCLPELAVCGYPPEDLLYKSHFIEHNIKIIGELAAAAHGLTAVVGFVDLKNGKLFNAAAVLSDGKIKAVYHKQELPNYGVFDEKRYFKPGTENFLLSAAGVKIGVNVCEDIWVDGASYAKQAESGARLLVNISSSPYEIGKTQVRLDLIARRAKETGCFICYTNLVGGQDELVFDGGSFIVDPKGQVVVFAKQFEEDLSIVDLDIPQNSGGNARLPVIEVQTSQINKPKHSEQNIPRLEETAEIYQALVLGTRDYVLKNGFAKTLIGLSGGIDSALVATIACDAIGKENVVGVSMPTRFNSRGTRNDARKLAANLGIEFMEIPIKRVMAAYEATLDPWFYGKHPDITEENLQARIRGNILMAFSNKFGWLVLTTGNKSEMAVGYCTLYGDMSGGFAVIKDLLKTKVYELSRFRNLQAGKMVIPKSVLLRAPSAELRDNQTDQDSLPPYDDLDLMLASYVENHESIAQMTAKIKDEKLCRKVIGLVDKSEYKRRQAPPGIKITSRAFGKDWRLPITNHYKESA
ncbi:MAG: NAD+ synthase [Candidatus Omnitrophica bacterium]|nr:NAD+ synthase [Candidatus Omnitrophota bacterium]